MSVTMTKQQQRLLLSYCTLIYFLIHENKSVILTANCALEMSITKTNRNFIKLSDTDNLLLLFQNNELSETAMHVRQCQPSVT